MAHSYTPLGYIKPEFLSNYPSNPWLPGIWSTFDDVDDQLYLSQQHRVKLTNGVGLLIGDGSGGYSHSLPAGKRFHDEPVSGLYYNSSGNLNLTPSLKLVANSIELSPVFFPFNINSGTFNLTTRTIQYYSNSKYRIVVYSNIAGDIPEELLYVSDYIIPDGSYKPTNVTLSGISNIKKYERFWFGIFSYSLMYITTFNSQNIYGGITVYNEVFRSYMAKASTGSLPNPWGYAPSDIKGNLIGGPGFFISF